MASQEEGIEKRKTQGLKQHEVCMENRLQIIAVVQSQKQRVQKNEDVARVSNKFMKNLIHQAKSLDFILSEMKSQWRAQEKSVPRFAYVAFGRWIRGRNDRRQKNQ